MAEADQVDQLHIDRPGSSCLDGLSSGRQRDESEEIERRAFAHHLPPVEGADVSPSAVLAEL